MCVCARARVTFSDVNLMLHSVSYKCSFMHMLGPFISIQPRSHTNYFFHELIGLMKLYAWNHQPIYHSSMPYIPNIKIYVS